MVDSITVRTQNMEETARELADLACTEALSFLLGQRIGQALKAFNLIHKLCQDAIDRKKPIREAALASHEARPRRRSRDDSEGPLLSNRARTWARPAELVDKVVATRRRVCGEEKEKDTP